MLQKDSLPKAHKALPSIHGTPAGEYSCKEVDRGRTTEAVLLLQEESTMKKISVSSQ